MNGVMVPTDYALIHADALRLPLRDGSIDAIITSPPYFALRSYQDEGEHYTGQIGSEPTPADFLEALWSVTDELWRVLKPTGSLWVNLGDKYANDAKWGGASNAKQFASDAATVGYRRRGHSDVPAKSLMGLPWRYALGLICPDTYRPRRPNDDVIHPQWTLRSEVIWSKPNGLPESVTDRARRSHEQWFHLTKQGRYYAAVDEVREPHSPHTLRYYGPGVDASQRPAAAKGNAVNGTRHRLTGVGPLGRTPGSVWTIPSEPLKVPAHLGVDHFAAFPQELVRRIILGWTPSGICTACGEGRVPVVDRQRVGVTTRKEATTQLRGGGQGGGYALAGADTWQSTEATITGYACACDVTLAPTRPATVLDPFVGTGTVPMVARALGRYGVGVDLSRDYLRLATWRISESRHGAKSINRTNRERQGKLL